MQVQVRSLRLNQQVREDHDPSILKSQPVIWQVTDGWHQGRGAWGGLTISRLAAEVAECENPDRALRTLSAQILEPVTVGEYLVSATCARVGSALSNWTVNVERIEDSRVVAHAQVITGTARLSEVSAEFDGWGTAVMPNVPSFDMVPIVPVGPPFAPQFTQKLEYRPISPLPLSGDQAMSLGWIRLPSRTIHGEYWSAAELMGIIDAWWPATYSVMESMRPMATVAFSVQLLIDPLTIAPVAGERAPLLHEASVSSAFAGFTSELRRLWTVDGRLVAENLQSIVVIK
jgi:hypothetical protein